MPFSCLRIGPIALLFYTNGGIKQNTGFHMRGIGTSVFSIGVEPRAPEVFFLIRPAAAGERVT